MTLLNESGITSLGEAVRTARLMGRMRQEDLAAAVGVSRSAVNEWEHGRSEPSASKMFAIARVTGQSLDWFAEVEYRSEGWGFESLRAHDCVETVDASFWSIVGCQGFPDTLFSFPAGVAL